MLDLPGEKGELKREQHSSCDW